MHPSLELFAAAFGLGMIFNATPGAVFAETIRRSMTGGMREALAVQFGSLTGDFVWAVLGLAGVGVLLQYDALALPVGIAGTCYLAWLAFDSWRQAYQNDEAISKPKGDAMRSGVIISMSNPQNVGFWAALGSAFGTLGVSEPDAVDFTVFLAGFMASSVLWCFLCAGLVARLFGRGNRFWRMLTYKLLCVAFAYLAAGTAYHLWKTIQPV